MSAAPTAHRQQYMRRYMKPVLSPDRRWAIYDVDPLAKALVTAYIEQEKARTGKEPKIGPLISQPLIKHFSALLPQAVVKEIMSHTASVET